MGALQTAQRQVLAKARVATKPREHHDLRHNRQRIADHDIGDGLHQRQATRLAYAARLLVLMSENVSPVSPRTASSPVKACHRSMATSI
jgi:hypothetical protein